MNEKTQRILLAIVAILSLSVVFLAGWGIGRLGAEKPAGGPDTLVVERWRHDTVRVETERPGGTVTVYLPVHDTVPGPRDTVRIRDSVKVEVPIVERVYAGESYRATVRGWSPELVDIWVRERETTVTVPYRKRWSFTVGPQVGVGYTPEGWQPYAGAGVTFGYNF